MNHIYILIGLLSAAAAYPHHHEVVEEKHDPIGESHHHHQVEHEHAKSHQSVKFHHFHPVPVYVKKEHSHLLKEPLNKGEHALKLKQVHPETTHQHGYGLVLEDLRHNTNEHEHGFEGFGGFADHSDHAEEVIHHVPEHHEAQGWAPSAQHYEGAGEEQHYHHQ